ncbi:MAG: cyclic nucleotide-binding/CBS domain-containing protein [Candidatus Nitrosotenuis sp.]
MTTAQDLMKEPITVSKDASVADALRKLVNEDISRVLISNNGEPVGVVTERDVGLFLLTEQTERKIDEVPITEIMNRLVTVDQSTRIDDCAQIMAQRDIGSLGVNFNGNTKGIITRTDLTRHYIASFVGEKRVGDVMTISFVSCNEDDPLYEALAKMINNHVSRIIVKDQAEKPVGVMSFRDLFRLSMVLGKEEQVVDNSSGITVLFSRKGMISETGFGATAKVKEAMTANMVTVEHDDDLTMACTTLIENDINAAAVLVNNKLTGILSKTDVVRAIAAISKKKKDMI